MKKFILLTALVAFCSTLSYAQPGSLDLSFGGKGWIKEDFIKTNYYYENALQILPQKNGTYIVAIGGDNGGPHALGRFLPNGTLDSSFGKEGYVTVAGIFEITKVVLQSDGKILIAGDGSLVRYNPDGSPDSTFNGNGMQQTGLAINAVTIQSDEKIVVAGYVGGDYIDTDFAIARFNRDGTPDLSFGTDGTIIHDFFGYDDIINSVALQNDGKIIVAGRIFFPLTCPRCIPDWGDDKSVLVRYNIDGSLDSSFGTYQVVNISNGFLSKQKDGKIVLAGAIYNKSTSRYDFALTRYNEDGSQDLSFNKNGLVLTDFGNNDVPSSIAFQSDGKIIITLSGVFGSNSDKFTLVRYNYDGSLDSSFDGDGKLITDFGVNAFANSVAVQSDGKIVAAGGAAGTNNSDFALARYNTDGSLDNTFSDDGKIISYVPVGRGTLYSIVVQPDGKIVVGGNGADSLNHQGFFISRYNPDGSPDKTFSGDGKQTTDFGFNYAMLSSLAIQSDGKLVAVGNAYGNNTSAYIAIARYNTDGSPDSSFVGNGKQVTNFGKGYIRSYANSVALQDDGKIVVGGSIIDSTFSLDFAIVRYNPDGSIDKTFGDDGLQTTDFNSGDDGASSVAIQRDKKIVLAGNTWDGSNNDFAIARYNTDGSLDTTFGNDGLQTTDFNSRNDGVSSVAIQRDNKIVLAGSTWIGSNNDFAIARYNTDGSLDTTFQKDGKITASVGAFGLSFAVGIQNDEKIVIVGTVSSNYSIADIAILRYNNNGSPDSSFDGDGKLITNLDGKERGSAAAIFNDKLFVAGVSVIASYNLADNVNNAPTVNITAPLNNTTYLAPANINITAVATDNDGSIQKVDFYNGTTLIFTEYNYPYSRRWLDVPAGDYIITAVATDDEGLTTTSAPVHISVVTPVVSSFTLVNADTDKDIQSLYDGIILDKNTLPQSLNIRANTTPKKVGSVVFILDGKKIRTENGFPFALAGDSPTGDYHAWTLPLGGHTLTAIPYAQYNGVGEAGTSLTIHFTVVNNHPITLSKKTPAEKDISGETVTVKLSPNPAHNILQININSQQNKKVRLSILSASGSIIKALPNLQSNRVEIDVSSLTAGTYFMKIISGEKTVYKRFVKL